jgi:ribosomal protein S18 acetylase RimI-like enzyme
MPSAASSPRSSFLKTVPSGAAGCKPMINLEPITPANALVFKAIRLLALRTDPTAFSATYAKESQLSDEEWFRRSVRWNSDGSIGYLAFDHGHPCGLVACYVAEKEPSHAHVISMWVDPAYRRSGVGTALIEGLKTWAVACNIRELHLMVTSVNAGAIGFYKRLGFQMTGWTGPYPNHPAIFEHEMRLRLDSSGLTHT